MFKKFLILFFCLMSVQAFAANTAKMVHVTIFIDNETDNSEVGTTIYTTLFAAQKVANFLQIEMISEETAKDDNFLFVLKSTEQMQLAFKIFDEEGAKVGDNTSLVLKGNNVRNLDISNLHDGTYRMVLTDGENELEKTFTVIRSK